MLTELHPLVYSRGGWAQATCLHHLKSGHESFAQLFNSLNIVRIHYMPIMWQQSARVPPSPPWLHRSSSLLRIFSEPVSNPSHSLTHPPPNLRLAPVWLVRERHRTSCDKQANTHKHAAVCTHAHTPADVNYKHHIFIRHSPFHWLLSCGLPWMKSRALRQ